MSTTTIHEDLKELLDHSFGSTHVIVGEYIVFLTVDNDDHPDSPDEWGIAKIYSFNRNHRNHIVGEPLEDLKEQYGPDIIPLSYFEHGNCVWGVAGTMGGMPDFRWDGVGYAGIWVPENDIVNEVKDLSSEDRHKKLVEYAANFCEAYTQYCNGDVYCCSVTVHRVKEAPSGVVYDRKEDYRFEEPVFDESCCGLYGDESVKDFLEETLKQASTHLKEAHNDSWL